MVDIPFACHTCVSPVMWHGLEQQMVVSTEAEGCDHCGPAEGVRGAVKASLQCWA